MARLNFWSIWGGLALIVLGLLFLLSQFLQVNLIRYLWPLFIVAAGSMFFIGMLSGGRGLSALAVPGSVIVTIGLILLVQSLTGLWATWTYAWALIIVGAGVGLMLFGGRGDIPEVRMAGRVAATIGVVLFFVFGLFFELGASLFGLRSPGGLVWPALLILFGLYVLFGRPLLERIGGQVGSSAIAFHSTSGSASDAVIEGSVRGPGGMVEQAQVSGVRRVRFHAIGDLTILQGEREALELEASTALKERIQAIMRGDTLEIRFRLDWWDWMIPRYWTTGPIRFTLYLRDLEQLSITGVGNILVPALTTQRLELNCSGTGSLTVRQLTAQELRVDLSGLGDVRVSGQVSRQDVNLSGSGSYHADELQSSAASVQISGLGSARVQVLEELDAQISGLGSIDYSGSPRINQRVSGLGSVRKAG